MIGIISPHFLKQHRMKIAIIGTGNVGGALATAWSRAGHVILLGVRNTEEFKGKELLNNAHTTLHSIQDAVQQAEVIVLSTPAPMAVTVAESLGDTTGKIIIDTMNIVMGRGPAGFHNTSDAILAHTQSRDVVKCFNTTGYNNIVNPIYEGKPIDMFMAGDSVRGKQIARELAISAGFGECHNMGGNDRFTLMEQFAFAWINLALMQGMGREFAFRLVQR